MGLPYSKQIRTAFSQSQLMMARLQTEVKPLVAAGYPLIASAFEVLKTTKNIAILLACVQVYTALMLTVQLVVLMLVLVCLDEDGNGSGDLEGRRRLVRPVVRGVVVWVERWGGTAVLGVKVGTVGAVAGAGWVVWRKGKRGEEERVVFVEEGERDEGDGEEGEDGEDGDRDKDGEEGEKEDADDTADMEE